MVPGDGGGGPTGGKGEGGEGGGGEGEGGEGGGGEGINGGGGDGGGGDGDGREGGGGDGGGHGAPTMGSESPQMAALRRSSSLMSSATFGFQTASDGSVAIPSSVSMLTFAPKPYANTWAF